MTDFKDTSKAGRESLLAGLNNEQKKAVLQDGGPMLILAGAGSGKTRVITHRIAHLVLERHVPPWRILAITFTNKAASEMKSRAAALIGNIDAMWIGTFHTMMLRILRQDCHRLGFAPGFSILDSDDQRRAVKDVLKDMGIDNTTIPLREITSRISFAKNEMVSPAELARTAHGNPYLGTIARVYENYVAYCKRHNGFDFDDILLYTLQLLREHEDLRARYQTRFLHILVDEYQDTNRVQYELVKLLAAHHRNLAVVGDDDQSIYRFRGADIRNILDFEGDNPDTTVIRLEQNYRSTKTILNAANAVIDKNESRKKKQLWTEGETGEPVTFYLASDHVGEAAFVANDIRKRRSSTADTEYAILYRASALTRNIEAALRERGISYAIFGGMRFYDRKEVKDVNAYIRLAVNPGDNLALTRIINVPKRGIGDQTVDALREVSADMNISMLEAARQASMHPQLSRAAGALARFVAIMDRLSALLHESDTSFALLVERVTKESGLAKQLEADMLTDLSARTRLENMNELISDALEFEKKYLGGEILAAWADDFKSPEEAAETIDDSLIAVATAYLEQTALFSDQDRAENRPDVNLMTIHSAKGLEFQNVYLVGAEERIFPSAQAEENDDLEEERRLCYVAMTRAKKRLTITAARSRLLYGRTQYNPPSRFLSDIPDELVNEVGGSKQAPPRQSDSGSQLFRTLSKLDSLRRKKADEQKRQAPEHNGIVWQTLKPGDSINHVRLGSGEILAITPTGDNAILRIRFAGGERRFLSGSGELSVE